MLKHVFKILSTKILIIKTYKKLIKKCNMDFFLHKPQKIGIIFGVFFCGIIQICNKNLVHDA
jgi:hypothetical protein